MRLVFAVFLLITLALPADAQPIPGAEAPAFAQARDLWLNGDDLPALQALGALARDGNTAAQMLLSQLALATHTHRHVTEDINRRDRIALLRQEGGLSGRDWMEAAAAVHSLAAAYWAGRTPLRDDLQIARNVQLILNAGDIRSAFTAILEPLLDARDPTRAQHAVRIAELHQRRLGSLSLWIWAEAQLGLIAHGLSQLPESIRTIEDFRTAIDTVRTPSVAFAAEGTAPFWRHFDPVRYTYSSPVWNTLQDYDNAILSMVATVPEAAPFAHFCIETCPDTFDSCVVSLTQAHSLTGSFPHPFASPSPALISTEMYQASARFFRDIQARAQHGNGRSSWPGCTP